MIKLFLLRWVALSVLYICASPIYFIKWLIGTHKTLRRFAVVREGIMTCPHCHQANSLNLLATCKRCGTTEFGSRLFCSNCRQLTKAFACEFCSATIKVL